MTDTASLGLEDRTARVIAGGQRVWDELTPLLASRSCTSWRQLRTSVLMVVS